LFCCAATVSVVTLNMAKETDAPRMLSELRAVTALRSADVLLLQEVKDHAAEDIAHGLGLHVVRQHALNSDEQGLAILSRWPLSDVRVLQLPAYDLGFHSRHRLALAATAASPAGPIRICTTHLDTRLNAAERLKQIAPLVDEAIRGGRPVLIGGDFNSNPFYWAAHVLPLPALHHQSESVWEYMRARGFQTTLPVEATTFDHLGMHLDWIWSRGLRAGDSAVFPLEFSDHHAVRMRVEL
jgi:endonuclease/exonuclease/phosphatase family metal-dependent hydrolase